MLVRVKTQNDAILNIEDSAAINLIKQGQAERVSVTEVDEAKEHAKAMGDYSNKAVGKTKKDK